MWLQIITRLLVDIEEDEVHVLIVYINKVYLKKRPANEQSCCYSALYGTILGCMLKIFVEREGGGGVFSELVSKDYTQLLSLTQTVRGWCTAVADMLV